MLDVVVSEFGFTVAEVVVEQNGKRFSLGYIVLGPDGEVLADQVSLDQAITVFQSAVQQRLDRVKLRLEEQIRQREALRQKQREAETERVRSRDMGMSR